MGQLISGRGGGANTVVYVATVDFRFGADVLTEKLVFDKSYETTGVGGSNLGIHVCYSLPPAQQHSFVRNLSSLFIKSIFPLRVAFEFGLGFDQILDKHIFLNTWSWTSLQLMLSLDTQRSFKHFFGEGERDRMLLRWKGEVSVAFNYMEDGVFFLSHSPPTSNPHTPPPPLFFPPLVT